MWGRVAAALVVILLATAGAGLAAAERGGDGPHVERHGGQTFQAAGYWSMTEPGPNGTSYETVGAVWMPVKRARGVDCFSFEVERTATETTVTVYCDPTKGRGKLMARFELETTVWDGQSGVGVDECVDRHDMRKNTSFTCTVANPDTPPAPEHSRNQRGALRQETRRKA